MRRSPAAMMRAAALVAMSLASTSAAPSATQSVRDVLTRTVGASSASIFRLQLDADMEQGFTLAPIATGEAGAPTVSVTASGLPELAYGAGYYLRTQANMSFAWERSGGNQVAAPAGGFPIANAITIKKKAKCEPRPTTT